MNNFPFAAARVHSLSVVGDKIVDASGLVAFIYTEGAALNVEMADGSGSRLVGSVADAKFYAAAKLTGEWRLVADGVVESPIARVEA
jgi:hypothetical protein